MKRADEELGAQTPSTGAAVLLAQPEKEQCGQTHGHSEGHLGVRVCARLLCIVYATPRAV